MHYVSWVRITGIMLGSLPTLRFTRPLALLDLVD
jgi:hypothetical protein